METRFLILLVALVADRIWPDQERLWRRLPHPVVLFGKAIELVERDLYLARGTAWDNRVNGLLAMLVLLALAAACGWVVSLVTAVPTVGPLLEIAVVTVLLAGRSLSDHVAAVASALRAGGLAAGREAVAKIVGRDPAHLDRSGVARSAIESLAENSSDGVVAPAFWYALLGLPGLFAYKMLNTADSMIGHLDPRHADIGRATAKTDDLANWIPARLTGLIVVAASAFVRGRSRAVAAFRTMMRDAGLHRSPNAGWPEAAFAGALDLALGGPRIYDGDVADEPMLNAGGRPDPDAADIDRALVLYSAVLNVMILVVIVLALCARP